MPPVYTYDHIHLRTKNPQATIAYYQKMVRRESGVAVYKNVEIPSGIQVPDEPLGLSVVDHSTA